ncbi:MAG: single-stranded DNA-binding protein [Anaerolineales bacterium]|nr:single-stranded DNA-binding protein [Anaerolineales bacterium]MCL4258470.1 single-stranded DNA-binding protein [Anaerolineales bacterium]QYK50208.1 MAG: single-stranded DNA-binding protein [Anaerolineales bacterium]
MSRGLNKVMLIGHLGRDPELRYTPGNRAVASFSLASSQSWTTAEGEKRSETEWFKVVAWAGLAEFANQYLKKGQQVYVEGRLKTRRWKDEQGNPRSIVEVVAREILMLSERRDKLEPEAEASFPEDTYPEGEEDEFPF